MRQSVIRYVGLVLVALLLTACGAASPGPMAWLDQPLDGSSYPLGPIAVQAHASDADGVASIEFFVDETPLTTASADGGRLADAMVEWNPTEPGTYTVRARATDSQGNVGSDATSVVTVGLLPTPSPTLSLPPEEEEIIFFVEPDAIRAGECAGLHWEVYPPVDALLDGEGVPSDGGREVCPETTRTYELLVPETGQTRTATLHVEPAPEMELAIFFAVDPDVISAGGCAALLWEVGAPEEWRVLIDGQEAPHVGQREECPSQTTTYELLVETPDGPQVRTVTLRVEAEPEPPPPPEPIPPPEPAPPPGCPGPPVISSFTANPGTISAGQSSTLSWGPVTNGNSQVLVRSVVINPGLGEVGSPGSRVVSPGSTTTYTMVATGCGGTTTRQLTVVVSAAPPPPPPSGADLDVTDLYPETLYGPVYGRITNHGPGTVTNAIVPFSCQWDEIVDPIEGIHNPGQIGPRNITITSLSPGQTTPWNTGINVDLHQYQYDISCSVSYSNDPNHGNDSHSEHWAE